MRGRVLVGADRRDVHQPRAVGRRRQRDRLGAERLHGVEALAAALEQDADEIDHHVGVARGRLDRSRIAQVGLHRVDLADPAERLQVAGEIGPAHRDPDAVAALGERAHHVAAEEARAAEDGDQRVDGVDWSCRAALMGWRVGCRLPPNTGSADALYRAPLRLASAGRLDLTRRKRPPLSVPRLCPGGGIGRRTSFRY